MQEKAQRTANGAQDQSTRSDRILEMSSRLNNTSEEIETAALSASENTGQAKQTAEKGKEIADGALKGKGKGGQSKK